MKLRTKKNPKIQKSKDKNPKIQKPKIQKQKTKNPKLLIYQKTKKY